MVIQGHRSWCQSKAHNYVTSYKSLIVTLAVSATVFEILMPKARKWLNFPTILCLTAPGRSGGGVPLECRDEIWHRKTRIAELPDGEEIMTLAFFVLIQYWRVTDRRTN